MKSLFSVSCPRIFFFFKILSSHARIAPGITDHQPVLNFQSFFSPEFHHWNLHGKGIFETSIFMRMQLEEKKIPKWEKERKLTESVSSLGRHRRVKTYLRVHFEGSLSFFNEPTRKNKTDKTNSLFWRGRLILISNSDLTIYFYFLMQRRSLLLKWSAVFDQKIRFFGR